MRSRLAALLLVATAACGTANADIPPPAPAPVNPARHPALQTLDRLAAAEVVPGVVGASSADAQALLDDHGFVVQVIEFEPTAPVTAQYPGQGAARPSDGVVTLWTGAPPLPPPPVEPLAPAADPGEAGGAPAASAPAAPTPSALPVATDPPTAPPVAQPTPPALPAPPPAVSSPAPAEADGPAIPNAAPPPRTSPRVRPPSEPGQVLEGRASWYGPGFAGRTTACGDAFDPQQLTLASRELRCGTRVRLTGPGGTTVEATVTDWGPAEWTGRRFDLSAATFAALAHPGAGVITVTAETL